MDIWIFYVIYKIFTKSKCTLYSDPFEQEDNVDKSDIHCAVETILNNFHDFLFHYTFLHFSFFVFRKLPLFCYSKSYFSLFFKEYFTLFIFSKRTKLTFRFPPFYKEVQSSTGTIRIPRTSRYFPVRIIAKEFLPKHNRPCQLPFSIWNSIGEFALWPCVEETKAFWNDKLFDAANKI